MEEKTAKKTQWLNDNVSMNYAKKNILNANNDEKTKKINV